MFNHRRKPSPFILYPLVFILSFLLSLPWVNAQAPKPKPQPWEINGIAAALQDEYPRVQYLAVEKLAKYQINEPKSLIKNYREIVEKLAKQLETNTKDALQLQPEDNPRIAAISALGALQAKEFAPQVALLLEDSNSSVQRAAASALGRMQAKEFAPQVAKLLEDSDWNVRSTAADALGQMQAKEFAPQVALLLEDSNSNVQRAAADALGQMQAKEFAPQVALLLKDSESYVRYAAAEALEKLGQQDLPMIVQIVDAVGLYHTSIIEDIAKLRFLAHFVGAGNQEVETLMQWVGKPKSKPQKLTHAQGKQVMELFDKVWKVNDIKLTELPDLRQELSEQIAEVARKVSWDAQAEDIDLLTTHYENLKNFDPDRAYAVQSVIINLEGRKWVLPARNFIITHIIFWIVFIFAYPKCPPIQAMFFWNPWFRRILGMGYVGFLLAWVPFLRRKLFEPFKPSLLADAGLDNFDARGYFPESMVKTPQLQPITQAIPNINGQIVLVGDSGLGKSMFLRHLVKISQQIVVYLPARKCEKGVIEAIQAKLHGQVQDTDFLKSLIYSGALDICIDGLNEVTADTRAQIKQFVESYFRGNIIMATQPLEWKPPTTAKMCELQPLTPPQIETFLLSRQQYLPADAKITGANYQKACQDYLQQVLNAQQPPEELAAIQRVLSNPMDLTLVALMLSQGEHPDLFRLQQQQYNLMAKEFLQEWGHEFPLKKFSQAVYQMRLNDESALPAEEFHQELESMEDEKYKMVVSRQWKDEKAEAKKEWYFRHDKIIDFFLVQNFLGKDDEVETRLIDHMGDSRFRGVYFLLATLLPKDAALELREKLIQYAADTKDHTVSDTFVQLLRTR